MLFIFLASLPRLFIYAYLGHETLKDPLKDSSADSPVNDVPKLKFDSIAAVGTGDVVITMFTGPFLFALGRAVELFVTQTTSVKNMDMGGIFLNRGRLILLMLFIPTGIIFFFIDKILIGIGEQKEVADKTW
jgi:Na+-driven multidrug efflux pump